MFKENQTIEDQNVPDNQAEQNKIRHDCLLKLAVGLGADEAKSRENIDALFAMADRLPAVDPSKEELDLEREGKQDVIETIKTIGSWFFKEERANKDFLYPVGLRALGLLKEPPDGNCFKSLDTMIGVWKGLDGDEKTSGTQARA